MVIYQRKKHRGELLAVLVVVLVVAVAAFIVTSVGTHGADEAAKNVEISLNRAVARCYAAEGAYPPDLGYIADKYGVDPNPGEYIVHYEYFGSNLMPAITVIPADPGRSAK